MQKVFAILAILVIAGFTVTTVIEAEGTVRVKPAENLSFENSAGIQEESGTSLGSPPPGCDLWEVGDYTPGFISFN